MIARALLGALVVLLAACDPPGKPGVTEDAQAPVMEFKPLYAQSCSGCHGNDGKNGPGRILNDHLYLAILPRDALRQILIHGRQGTAMPAWAQSEGGPLTLKQIDVLVDGVYKEWAKPVDFHGEPSPSYAGDLQGSADAGRKLFGRNCYVCHGPGAKVGLVTDPSYLSLVSNQMLRTSILVGRPDLGMPDYRHLKLGKALTDQDVTDLVAFLASKRPANAGMAQGTESASSSSAGQQRMGASGHVNDVGSGQGGATGKGNEGSGNGPGSPKQRKGEGNKSTGGSSQQGIK